MESLEWLQVDCSLFAQFDGSPFLPWRTLAEAAEKWRTAGLYEWFWFVRKMPGLKLRFGGPGVAARLQAPLAEWLHHAERANEIRGFRFTIYEPEIHRFGGEAGMAVAHSHFDNGAQLVLAYESQAESLPKEVDRLTFSLANTNDLLDCALADEAEIWDVWKRLYAIVGGRASDAESDEPLALAGGFENLPVERSSQLGELIAAAQTANAACAEALRALAAGGVLQVGVRAWLTAATTFEWNRFGLPDQRERLTAAITQILRIHQPDTFIG
ncbi:MAG TPA: thiopeptide-type bacteriocin biosynthesis protein [Pyrinomonadaceae bacterium]|nr:thiopeptide-type bacteriocin biosynthesis protein [Pyrinomonadaceae bacterium]